MACCTLQPCTLPTVHHAVHAVLLFLDTLKPAPNCL